MAVLKILAQDDRERKLCEDRLKAKYDLQTLETLRDPRQQCCLEAEHRWDVVRRERDEASRRAEQRGLARSSER
jgi:hypothetical protein